MARSAASNRKRVQSPTRIVQAQFGQLEFDMEVPALDEASASKQPRRSRVPGALEPSARTLDLSKPSAGTAETPVKTSPTKAKSSRRSRVPDNLAEQYGQNLSRRPAEPPPTASPRKRRTAAEREQRRQLMAPDPGLLQRLARVNDAASKSAKRVPRPRGWQFHCGRCGTRTGFQTPAGLCPGCGAIAVRE